MGNGDVIREKNMGAGSIYDCRADYLLCIRYGMVMYVYGKNMGAVGVATVLGWCVIPFIIPDIVKIVLALALSKRLAGVIRGLGR